MGLLKIKSKSLNFKDEKFGYSTLKTKCKIWDFEAKSVYNGFFQDLAPIGKCIRIGKTLPKGRILIIDFNYRNISKKISIPVKVLGFYNPFNLSKLFPKYEKVFNEICEKFFPSKYYLCEVLDFEDISKEYEYFHESKIKESYAKNLINNNLKSSVLCIFKELFNKKKIEFKIAETKEEREAAYNLVYYEYLKRNFIERESSHIYTSIYQILPVTTTFVGKLDGEVVLTISSVQDSSFKLPMDKVFGDILDPIRNNKRHLVEFTMLAIKRDLFGRAANSLRNFEKMLALFSIFRLVIQHSMEVFKATDIVISINPCYEKLYKYINFNKIGDLRYYKEFHNQPAVAYRLDINRVTNPNFYKTDPTKYCLAKFLFMKKLPQRVLNKNIHLGKLDLDYLFCEHSELVEKLSNADLKNVSKSFPELSDWVSSVELDKQTRTCLASLVYKEIKEQYSFTDA